MYRYQPHVAAFYDGAHAYLIDNPTCHETETQLASVIRRYHLNQRAIPTDYSSRHWAIFLRDYKQTGNPPIADDPGHEVKGYFLSAFHQLRMHQFKPDVGIEYADLHEALACDGQDERIMGKLVDLIVSYNLREGKPPEGYDPPTMQKQADALLRRNRDQPFR